MGIRGEALQWLQQQFSVSDKIKTFTSKYYPPNQSRARNRTANPVQAWWIEIPKIRIMEGSGVFHFVCQRADNLHDFYYLAVNVQFIRDHLDSLYVRSDNDKLSLWLSAETSTLFTDLRGDKSVSFSQFLRN